VTRVFFFLAEALRALRRSAAPSLAAIVTVVLTTLLIGVFVPVIKASSTTNQNVRSELTLRVFMKQNATTKQAVAVQKRINKIPHVERTDYVSKADALKELRGNIGKGPLSAGLTQLKHNPLPITINVYPDDADNLNSIQRQIVRPSANGKARPISPAIKGVGNSQQLANQIRTVTNAVKIILSVIAVLLLVASLMLVANTIRLSIYARRREVEVMKLVGATNWFIRWPFVIEGLIVGLLGAGIAIGLLWVGKIAIIDPLAQNFALIDNFSTIGFAQLIALLAGSAVVISALGSGVTLRRFLRI
jgi:cell division transport system permease protein